MGPIHEGRPPGGEPPSQRTLRVIAWDVDVALEHLEAVLSELDRAAGELPTEPLERAALVQRTETVAAELRWLQGQVAKLASRTEPAEARHAERADDTALTRRACIKPWESTLRPVCRVYRNGRGWSGCV